MKTADKVHVPVLIAGGGITGLTAALFLLQQGIRPLLVERHPGTSIHPRARGFDIRTMELFRELGLSAAIREAGKALGPAWGILRADTLTAALAPVKPREGGKITYPSQLKGLEHLAKLSPESGARCTQDLSEPVLRTAGEERGADLRFNTEMTEFSQDHNGVTAILKNRETGETTTITADYLIAADGANSPVRRKLNLPVSGPGVLAQFLNIYFEADMGDLVKDREFSLCIIDRPELLGFVTAINNSDRWVYQLRYYPDNGEQAADYPEERLLAILRSALGMPELQIQILSVLPWEMTARATDTMQSGRIFLIGDAAHTMTPYGGKGANTGIQDAQNLSWKLAAVLKGYAAPTLLNSYTTERQPIGLANTLRSARFADSRGMLKEEEIMLRQPSGQLQTWKESSQEADSSQHLRTLIGIADYQYPITVSSTHPARPSDKVFYGLPGMRIPHFWMDENSTKSVLDTVNGKLTLFVHGSSDPWMAILKNYPIPVQVLPIAESMLAQWKENTGSSEGEAILVRPDGFVAWRGKGELPLKELLS